MAKWTSIEHGAVAPAAAYQGPRDVSGCVRSARLSPSDYSLWLCDSELADGARMSWSGAHSDDAVYVLSGELDVDGRRCPAGGTVVVESDAAATAVAHGPTRVAHFGSVDAAERTDGPLGPPAADGHSVHVVGPDGMFVSGQQENVHAVWFADGTCPTCRVQLLEVIAPPTDDPQGKAHSHSEDEIIYVLDGTISMGAYSIAPFTALSIPGDVRYALGGGPHGHRFINFRRDVSIQIYGRNTEPLLETAIARGGHATNDIR